MKHTVTFVRMWNPARDAVPHDSRGDKRSRAIYRHEWPTGQQLLMFDTPQDAQQFARDCNYVASEQEGPRINDDEQAAIRNIMCAAMLQPGMAGNCGAPTPEEIGTPEQARAAGIPWTGNPMPDHGLLRDVVEAMLRERDDPDPLTSALITDVEDLQQRVAALEHATTKPAPKFNYQATTGPMAELLRDLIGTLKPGNVLTADPARVETAVQIARDLQVRLTVLARDLANLGLKGE